MKRLFYLSVLVMIGILPVLTGCGENKAEQEARIETARQDSIREAQRLEEERLEEERLEREKREAEEREREREKEMREGPSWLQGTWEVKLYDDYGNYLGEMLNTFRNGVLTVSIKQRGADTFTFDYSYTMSSDLSTVYLSNNGRLYLKDNSVFTADGKKMERKKTKYYYEQNYE